MTVKIVSYLLLLQNAFGLLNRPAKCMEDTVIAYLLNMYTKQANTSSKLNNYRTTVAWLPGRPWQI